PPISLPAYVAGVFQDIRFPKHFLKLGPLRFFRKGYEGHSIHSSGRQPCEKTDHTSRGHERMALVISIPNKRACRLWFALRRGLRTTPRPNTHRARPL